MTVDAHAHVWVLDPERYPWQPLLGYIPKAPFPPDELLGLMDTAGVDQAVIVQPSVYGWDNSFVLAAAEKHPDRFVVVALLDPDSPSWLETLHGLVVRAIRGVRFNLVAKSSAEWIIERRYLKLWAALAESSLPACFQATMGQLSAVDELATSVPSLRIVVDHLGKPDLVQGPGAWQPLLALSSRGNVFVKVSGFHEQGIDWTGFRPVIMECISAFGVDRLMWGSDSPGALRVSDYQNTMAPIRTQPLKPPEFKAIFDRTARRVFRLPMPHTGEVDRTDSRQ
jgi:predicted TIM-barrel fold metal-dependent hydrolase